MKDQHPIRRADVQAAVENWTKLLLDNSPSGSGEVEVVLRFNVKDRKFLGLRLGGAAGRLLLTEPT